MGNALIALVFWWKKRVMPHTVIDWLHSTEHKICKTRSPDSLNSSHEAKCKLHEKAYAWTLKDPENVEKFSETNQKQPLNASHNVYNSRSLYAINTLSKSRSNTDAGLMDRQKVEPEDETNIIELIRKEQLIDREQIWKAINEIRGNVKEAAEGSEEIISCALSKRSKIPILQNKKLALKEHDC